MCSCAFLAPDLASLSPQSVADLVGEIAALEQEVIRKELHLLALYRRAFDQYVSESCSFTSEVPYPNPLVSDAAEIDRTVRSLTSLPTLLAAGGPRISEKHRRGRATSEGHKALRSVRPADDDHLRLCQCCARIVFIHSLTVSFVSAARWSFVAGKQLVFFF
jgi:hypothetical protein